MGFKDEQDKVSRRSMLGASAALAAFGAARPAAGQGPDRGGTHPGPKNGALDAQNPDAFAPPLTDHGGQTNFKFPFSFAHNRFEKGGWARQVTMRDLPISVDLAGVNMRLNAGGIREMHWHLPAEWAFMLYGSARITCIDLEGRSYVQDVKAGDLWYFPSGIPHSLQGLGPDGAEFLLVFDDGNFSEYETFSITDWMAHTPRGVVAKNFQIPEAALNAIPEDELYIFPAPLPGPFADDARGALGGKAPSPLVFHHAMASLPPTKRTAGGEVRIVDSQTFKVSTTIAAALVTVHPGGVREMHWHPNASEWQYYIGGSGRMTVFAAAGRARTLDFTAGDVGYVPRAMGHYVENTGSEDLRFLEMFKTSTYQDISLVDWVAHTPPDLVTEHLHIDRKVLESIQKDKPVVTPT